MMNRFLVFSGMSYYPFGGWRDFDGSYETAKEAKAAAYDQQADWWQVVDGDTGDVVHEGYAK